MPARILIHILLAVLAVSFGASRAPAREIRDEGIIATAPPEAYAGSASCRECHEPEFDQWSETLKARFVRYRKDVGDLPGQWEKGPLRGREDDVFVVVGLNRKVAFVDADWRVMGAEYRLDGKRWKKKRGWDGADYRSRCGMCHLTGCNPYEKRFVETGVGCEACHGPGKRHIESGEPADIAVPGRDGKAVLDSCRRCHNDRNNHAEAIRGFSGTYHAR